MWNIGTPTKWLNSSKTPESPKNNSVVVPVIPLAATSVNVFPGGFNWPIFVAQDKGFFERNGIFVRLLETRSSVSQMAGLAKGEFDIAMTAFDNIVAYGEGYGEAPIGPQPEFFAFMGSDNGFLSLVVAPQIKTFDDLKGTALSVDARTTGYAFVLFELLRRNHLEVDTDCRIEPSGGMAERWAALLARKHAGTLLSTPFNLLASDRGFVELARVPKVLGPYQGNVAAARRSWAQENPGTMTAFVRSYAQAVDWLYDVKHREDAVRLLLQRTEISPRVASRTYDQLLDAKDGFFRSALISPEGMMRVLTLRNVYGNVERPLLDPTRYYDPRYRDAAIG
jgi:ABC-type nitrate/sulfonate/bicarbonate transport system substrate-binding protein